MPEPTQHVQATVDAKADEPELELGSVVSYNGRYAFVRPDRGGPDVYVGTPQLLKARIGIWQSARVFISKRAQRPTVVARGLVAFASRRRRRRDQIIRQNFV